MSYYISFRMNSMKRIGKGLVVWCHSFCLFWYFLILTFIPSPIEEVPLYLHIAGQLSGKNLGCRAGNRLWACLTGKPIDALPSELRRTLSELRRTLPEQRRTLSLSYVASFLSYVAPLSVLRRIGKQSNISGTRCSLWPSTRRSTGVRAATSSSGDTSYQHSSRYTDNQRERDLGRGGAGR